MSTNTVVASACIIFVYLIVHSVFLHYTFRNLLLCLDKHKLNANTNAQAKQVYSSSVTFYGIRTALNIIYVLADVSALTALLMSTQNGMAKSRSGWILIRCCCDVRDALAMYLGCSVVLSVATGLCRTVEIYIMTFTPYDTTECCGLKRFFHHRGRFDNPEYSSNIVSRYVGFAIINFLMIGFKGVVMVRLFELYDDLSEAVESEASFSKLRRLMLYSNADYSRTPGRSKEATSYIMATKSGSL